MSAVKETRAHTHRELTRECWPMPCIHRLGRGLRPRAVRRTLGETDNAGNDVQGDDDDVDD